MRKNRGKNPTKCYRKVINKVYRRFMAKYEAKNILSDLDDVKQRIADITVTGTLESKRTKPEYDALLSDPMLKFSGLYQEGCSDLYVTCQILSDGVPLALPVTTSYKAFTNRWKLISKDLETNDKEEAYFRLASPKTWKWRVEEDCLNKLE